MVIIIWLLLSLYNEGKRKKKTIPFKKRQFDLLCSSQYCQHVLQTLPVADMIQTLKTPGVAVIIIVLITHEGRKKKHFWRTLSHCVCQCFPLSLKLLPWVMLLYLWYQKLGINYHFASHLDAPSHFDIPITLAVKKQQWKKILKKSRHAV